jgi:hypothetical protein
MPQLQWDDPVYTLMLRTPFLGGSPAVVLQYSACLVGSSLDLNSQATAIVTVD